jgi:hypothetical protein
MVGVLDAQVEVSRREKSPATAQRLSFATSALPITVGIIARDELEAGAVVLIVGGLVLGPVSGYAYAGETGRGMAQVGLRAIASAATVGAVALVCTAGCQFRLFGGGDDGGLLVAAIVAVAGTALVTNLARRDILRVGDVVRAENRPTVGVRPQYFPGSRSGGLAVTWRF